MERKKFQVVRFSYRNVSFLACNAEDEQFEEEKELVVKELDGLTE